MSIASLMASMTLESSQYLDNTLESDDELELMEIDKEIEEATAEAEKADKDLEELDSSTESLEGIAGTLEADMAEGGISPQAAKYLALTMEAVMGDARVVHIGGKQYLTHTNPVLSMESFGGNYTQEEASAMTLEGIKDTLKRAYQAVKNAGGRSINATRELFGKLFRGTKGLKKTLDKQRSSVAEVEDGDKEEIKIGAFGARLHVGGDVSARTVTEAVSSVNEIGEKLLNEYLDKSIKLFNDLSSGMADVARGRKEAEEALKEVKDNLEDASDELEDLTKRHSAELPGGFQLIYSTDPAESGSGNQKQKDAAGYSLSTLTVEKQDRAARRYNTGQKVEAASKKDLEGILDNVEKMIETIDGRKDAMDKLVAEREAAMSAGEAMIKDISLDEDGEGDKKGVKKDSKALTKLLRVANKNAGRSITNYTTYSWRVARASLMYVNANLKARGKQPVTVEGGEGDE